MFDEPVKDKEYLFRFSQPRCQSGSLKAAVWLSLSSHKHHQQPLIAERPMKALFVRITFRVSCWLGCSLSMRSVMREWMVTVLRMKADSSSCVSVPSLSCCCCCM